MEHPRPIIPRDLLAYATKIAMDPITYLVHLGASLPTLIHDTVSTVVLHREGQFQVEAVISKPGAPTWPGQHSHPDVDSIEIGIYNAIGFIRKGQVVQCPDLTCGGLGFTYLDHTDEHTAPYKEQGFIIFSVQKWLNGVKPSSVGLNWHGEPVHPSHAEQQKSFKGEQ